MKFAGMTLELGVCMGSGLDEDGFPIAQFDAQGEEPRTESFELHHPFGFASLPRDPEKDSDGQVVPGKACNMWRASEGNSLHGILAFDPRFIETFPKLKKGGSMRYCAAGSFSVMDGDDGTITEYIPVPGDKAHVLTRGLDGNADPFVGIEHSSGMAMLMLRQSLVLKNASGSVYIELQGDKVVVNGNTVLNGGATIGSPAGALPVAILHGLQTWATQLEQNIAAAFTAVGAGSAAAGAAGAASFASGSAGRAAALAAAAATKLSAL